MATGRDDSGSSGAAQGEPPGHTSLAWLDGLSVDEAQIAETVRAVVDAGDTVGRVAGPALNTLMEGRAVLHRPATERGVSLGEVLGTGGMGEVRQGFQPTLRRPVAVKQLHGQSAEGVTQLLREAWIAGFLEHPNILPVHDLAGSADSPLMVMKLIEGVPWSEALHDPRLATGDAAPSDPIQWQLDVLLDVCRAVRFAHARGVVHLDLKPANVMLGPFGEVYLVDWGLAATYRPDAPDWLPRVSEIQGLIGTPAYMAPEQVSVAPGAIGPRTDVYQLGGVLYHVVTGQQPRQGSPLKAALMASRGELPDLSTMPRGLAEVCAKALAPNPDDRYPDAAAFAAAVEGYLRHRHAQRLTDEAHERLRQLRDTPAEAVVTLEQLATECGFAFDQALQIWPESEAAQAGRLALVTWQVKRDLALGAPEAAEARLARLGGDVPEALITLVAEAKAERAAREAEAEALRSAHDVESGRKERVAWLWGIGIAWIVWNAACGLIDRHVRAFDYPTLLGMSTSTLALYLLGRRLSRPHLADTEFNRRAVALIGVGLGIIAFFWYLGWSVGLSPRYTVAFSSTLYLLFAGIITVFLDSRLWRVVAVEIAVVIGAGLAPDYAFEWVGLAGAACALGAVWLWRQPARRQGA